VKDSNKSSFLRKLTGGGAEANDAARLEAFLSAFPGEYCGWSERGEVIASPGLPALLGAESIRSLADIQSRLDPGDAAALEGLMDRLRRSGANFAIAARTHDGTKSSAFPARREQPLTTNMSSTFYGSRTPKTQRRCKTRRFQTPCSRTKANWSNPAPR
jgi:hypothetical protein